MACDFSQRYVPLPKLFSYFTLTVASLSKSTVQGFAESLQHLHKIQFSCTPNMEVNVFMRLYLVSTQVKEHCKVSLCTCNMRLALCKWTSSYGFCPCYIILEATHTIMILVISGKEATHYCILTIL